MRKAYSEEVDSSQVSFEEFLAEADDADDEAYLGASTLAKLRAGGLDFDDEDYDEDEDDEDDVADDEDDEDDEEDYDDDEGDEDDED